MKTIRAIFIGVMIWVLGVSIYTLSFSLTLMEDPEQQANLVLLISIFPLVWLGSKIYYKKDKTTHGFSLGLTFLLVSGILDALITVPVFMKPYGIDHYAFFTALEFWLVALVFISTAVLYFYLKVLKKTMIVNK